MRKENPTSIRQALADHTRVAHETLHHHQWIGCLTSPLLTSTQYSNVLRSYLHFYKRIESERTRLGEFDYLSLSDPIAFLESDTSPAIQHESDVKSLDRVRLKSKGSALGSLYVLHGARFGAAILNKNVQQTLPASKRQFLQNSTPRSQWRDLIATIESVALDDTEQQDMFLSADLTFSAFGEWVTEYCESATAG